MRRSTNPASNRSTLEILEPRRLMAATTYDFAKLVGYSASGHSWTYNSNYTITSNVLDDSSGSGSGTVTVQKQGKGSPTKYKISISNGGGDENILVQTDSNGTNVLQINSGFGGGSIKLDLTGTQLAPKSLAIGQSSTDAGTFSGTFSGDSGDLDFSGSITGKTTATCKLTDSENVATPAGHFTAVKGSYSVSLTGTLKAKIQGHNFNIAFSESLPQTFWATQSIGIVKSQGTLSTQLTVQGENATLQAKVTSKLSDYSPKPSAAPMIPASTVRANGNLIDGLVNGLPDDLAF